MTTPSKTIQQDNYNIDDEEIKRINEEWISSSLITPDRLYVDLRLLKDFNIGCLLSFAMQKAHASQREGYTREDEYKEMYDKIVALLPEYNQRRYDDVGHAFPFMEITSAQITERLADPRYSAFIFHHAPATRFVESLVAQIAVNVNHSAVAGKRDPIEILINTHPLRLDANCIKATGTFIAALLGVTVRVVYQDITKWQLAHMKIYDEVYTYHLKEIMDVQVINEEYSKMGFINKRLFAAKLFGNEFILHKDTTRDEVVIRTRLDILTQFTFINPHLFSAPPPIIAKESVTDG